MALKRQFRSTLLVLAFVGSFSLVSGDIPDPPLVVPAQCQAVDYRPSPNCQIVDDPNPTAPAPPSFLYFPSQKAELDLWGSLIRFVSFLWFAPAL
jgi:hypothetical protein